MAWAPKGRHLLACGLAFGTSAGYVLANSKKLFSQSSEQSDSKQTSDLKSQLGGAFPSELPLQKVLASWTTNFQPSVRWDDNWDRRDPKSMMKPPKKNKKEENNPTNGSGDAKSESKEQKDEKNEENELKKATPKKTRHLFLIRHGQYEMEHPDDKGRILTLLGRDQAEYTGKRLKELDHPYTKLINSTMTRAKETSDIVAEQLTELPRESCDLLREGAPIPPEPPVGHWKPEAWQFYEDGARIEGAFRKYFHRAEPEQTEDSYEIIVCHANVIRYFVCRALQLPPEAWLRISLRHASITWVAIRPSGRVSLRALGDSGHIPADKLSFN